MAAITGFSCTIVDAVVQLKRARFALAVDEVAQGAAAGFERQIKRVFNRANDAFATLEANTTGRNMGMNAGAEQRFVGINISDADHLMLIHQKLFDTGAAAPAGAI